MVKYMVRFAFILGFMILIFSCKTQLLEAQAEYNDHDIVSKTKGFTLDDLGYLYLINTKNELVRYDPGLIKQFAYSNERLGSLTSVDANNPLKLLLFYENYQTIIMLDNLLGEIGRYNLFDLGFNDVNAVGMSNDNNVWLYDPIDYKLKKIDKTGRLLTESITMYNEGLESIRPTFLVEEANMVFLYDKNSGFFVFDNLGQYLYNISIKGLDSYQVLSEKKIVYLADEQIYTYDLTYKSSEVFKPISDYAKGDISHALIAKKFIYLRDKSGVWKKPI